MQPLEPFEFGWPDSDFYSTETEAFIAALTRSLEELVCEPPDNAQESGVRNFVVLVRSQQRLTDAYTR